MAVLVIADVQGQTAEGYDGSELGLTVNFQRVEEAQP